MKIVRVLSCLLVVVAVGCGREGAITSVSAPGASQAPTATTTAQAAATDAPTTPAPTTRPAATPAPAATKAPAATAPMSEAALEATLLTVGELPGWTAGGPSSGGAGGDDDDYRPCGKQAQPKYAPTHEAMAEYNQGQIGDQLQLTNESHPSVAHAAASIKEARDQVASCPTWTETEDDGTTVTFTAKEQAFPNIADETLAIRIEVVFKGNSNGAPFEVHGDALAVGARLGQNIVGTFHMALGINTHPELDTSETESIARKAVAKFKRTA